MSKKPTYILQLTAAVVIDGVIRKRGENVEVDKPTAENLLHRGRAELVGADEADEGQVINLGQMLKPDLIELALEYGVENPEELTVDQLREAIKAAAAE